MKARKILALVLAFAMIMSTMSLSVLAAGDTDELNAVAQIGDQYYSSLNKALDDAALSSEEDVVIIVHQDITDIPASTKRANITFKAAQEGAIKVTSRTYLPTTELEGYFVYDGFDFSEMPDWAVCGWHGNEKLEKLELTYRNCIFGAKAIGFWAANDNWNFKKLLVDDCTFVKDGSQVLNIQNGTETIIQNCDFTAVTGAIGSTINMPAKSRNLTLLNNNFGTGYIMLSQNLGDYNRNLVMEGNIFLGEKAVRIHQNFTNAATGFGDVTITGNTFGDETAVMAFPANVDVQEYFESNSEELIFAGNLTDTGVAVEELATGFVPEGPVANINGVYYTSLEAAFAAAGAGDVIDLLDNVIVLPETNVIIKKNLTIENGTIDITNGVWKGNSIIEICGGTASDFVTVTFNNVDFVGDNYSSAYGVIYAYNYGKAVINDSDFVLSNERFSEGGVLKGNGVAQSAFDVNNSTFTLENPNRIIANATVNLDNVIIDAAVTDDTLVVGTMNNHAFRNLVGTVNDSDISVDGFETGIKNTDGSLTVTGDSKVVLTNSKDTDLIVSGNNSLSVADTSELIADTTNIADTSKVTGNVVKRADAVEVDFELYNEEETEITYDIVLKGINEETINRLNSADLTFALTQKTGKNIYEIVDVADDHITFNPVYNVADGSIIDGRYEFHFETKTGVANDTASEIVIARVKFTGYGTFGFGVAEAGTNVVHATKIRDNIVDTYVPNDDTTSIAEGELVIDNDFSAEIAIPRRALTVKVSFPNGICENDAAYQDMTLSIVGDGVEVNEKLGYGLQKESNGVVYYEFKCGDTILNTPYTVTLEGAGYRTVKYTVNMTEAKTLNFWNNVKDNEVYVEESASGIKKYAQKVTFLAGDIVKDDDINIYDLSAVVSYFGEIDLSKNNKPTYAKYDLNRDGKIDSKDVAYVLVSWGN